MLLSVMLFVWTDKYVTNCCSDVFSTTILFWTFFPLQEQLHGFNDLFASIVQILKDPTL